MAHADIDRLINWPDFYRKYLPDIKPAGADKMSTCCPFHHEENPSFWFRPSNGMFKCHGCGAEGNATQFLARVEEISTKESWKRLCEIAGVPPQDNNAQGGSKQGRTAAPRYTLTEYALEKRLPKEWLQGLGVRDAKNGGWVEIPYKDEDDREIAIRKRMPPGHKPRFLWNRGASLNLYGLWRMEEIHSAGYVVLVEGESDAQTFWHLGIPALGLPGANTFNASHAAALINVPLIYLHIEPDKGGRIMRRKVAQVLLEMGYEGTVMGWACSAHQGCKDPSALYLKEAAQAEAIIGGLMKGGRPVDLELAAQEDVEGMAEAPIALKLPPSYEMDNMGIRAIEKGMVSEEPFCWTPVLITRFLTGVATRGIKMELAYMRDSRWHKLIVPRSTLASSRSIVELSDTGLDVNTENGGKLVKFLSALERENMGRIPEMGRITHYGWIDSTHFAPGAADDFYLDTEGSGRTACLDKPRGSYDAWKAAMQPHRQRDVFRFVMASAFAAPLIHLLGQRIYLVHNWGDSKGGKTAAMHAALSVWGNPEKMMISFNATQVGMERAAGFFCDLPMGINERQLAGNKQQFIESLVYMLAEGSGKLRGNKQGGLQEQTTWRSVILTNGEEALTVGTSQTGISTRALEVFGAPFTNELEASAMYSLAAQHHGHAGVDFIRRLIGYDKSQLRQVFTAIQDRLRAGAGKHSQSHIASVAVSCTADYLADQWVFGADEKAAMDAALGMGRAILAAMQTTEELDVNEKANKYIIDWILSNIDGFGDNYRNVRLGYAEREEPGQDGKKPPPHHVLIFPSLLEKELTKAGYSYGKTMRWLAEHGKIETRMRGGRTRCTLSRRIDGAFVEMIRYAMPQGVDMSGFTEVDDSELPAWED